MVSFHSFLMFFVCLPTGIPLPVFFWGQKTSTRCHPRWRPDDGAAAPRTHAAASDLRRLGAAGPPAARTQGAGGGGCSLLGSFAGFHRWGYLKEEKSIQMDDLGVPLLFLSQENMEKVEESRWRRKHTFWDDECL